jgi:hypothetical protein
MFVFRSAIFVYSFKKRWGWGRARTNCIYQSVTYNSKMTQPVEICFQKNEEMGSYCVTNTLIHWQTHMSVQVYLVSSFLLRIHNYMYFFIHTCFMDITVIKIKHKTCGMFNM